MPKIVKNLLTYIAVILTALIFTSFVAQLVNIQGQSMEPNYHDKDIVIMEKITKNYKQGDVIVINHVLDRPIIKRVIATAGQTVDINTTTNEITVDGVEVPAANFNATEHATKPADDLNKIDLPATVPENCVFVLGDNRAHSADSRRKEIGMVPVDKVMGKVLFKLWPLS